MKKLLVIIALFMAFINISFADETADHKQFEILKQAFTKASDVTKACLTCHTEASKQMHKSIHWTWKKTRKNGRETGKDKVINNFCVAVSSNEPRCTSCHTGYGWKDKTFDFSSEENVDCLVCHDQTGKYKKFPTAAGHPAYEDKIFMKKKKFPAVDLSAAAQSVGKPQISNCGSCHFNGGGGNGVKHGDLDQSLLTSDKKLDVHMGAGMTCIDCHKTEKHIIPGSNYEHSGDVTRPTCANSCCHTEKPHKLEKLNDHLDVVACQTCHISEYARGGFPTKMWWDWSKAGDKDREKAKNYNKKKGEFVWKDNVIPEYFWHNGDKSKSFLVTDKFNPKDAPIWLNELAGKPGAEDSKIFPFKVHRGKQIYDTEYNNFIIPRLFGKKGSGSYWSTFDWGIASKTGMEYVGVPYSGKYGFIETAMYWPITHMVGPKEDAVTCNECHTSYEDSRMKDVTGVYMPGRNCTTLICYGGFGLLGLTVLGIIINMFTGAFVKKEKIKIKEDED